MIYESNYSTLLRSAISVMLPLTGLRVSCQKLTFDPHDSPFTAHCPLPHSLSSPTLLCRIVVNNMSGVHLTFPHLNYHRYPYPSNASVSCVL